MNASLHISALTWLFLFVGASVLMYLLYLSFWRMPKALFSGLRRGWLRVPRLGGLYRRDNHPIIFYTMIALGFASVLLAEILVAMAVVGFWAILLKTAVF